MVIAAAPRRGCIALAAAAICAVASSACHVRVQSDTARPVATERIQHPEGAIARRPTVVLADGGRLRFIEPLECPTEEIVRQDLTTEVMIRPNLATFTVGVIAATVGGVMLTSGLFSKEPGASPFTYIGLASVAVGLPFAIGPWIGNGTEVQPGTARPTDVVRRPGPSEPCGARPLAARSATLETAGLEVHGSIDRDGWFSISPYQWIDAFNAASALPAAVTAAVDGEGGRRTITAVLEAAMLARHAAGFLARTELDVRIEPLKLVTGISPGTPRAALVTTGLGPALRVVLPLRNDGPGDAWALRGQLAAPTTPAIDGRMIYIGHLAKGAAIAREIDIALSPAAAAALRNKSLELSVELRDAHGTAPATPVRFRATLTDPPK
jgi:hypothetical protein